MKRSLIAMVGVAVMLLAAVPASAAPVSFTVGGWGPQSYPISDPPPSGFPGDDLQLEAWTGTLDLTPGTDVVLKINTLDWTIRYTVEGTADFDVTAGPRSISFDGGATGSLSQSGLLECRLDTDYLTFYDGSTVSLNVQGYTVEVTPLGFDRWAGYIDEWCPPRGKYWPQTPAEVTARFVVTPEPATLAMLALGGLAILRRRRK
jgi:hypothetical protein